MCFLKAPTNGTQCSQYYIPTQSFSFLYSFFCLFLLLNFDGHQPLTLTIFTFEQTKKNVIAYRPVGKICILYCLYVCTGGQSCGANY